MAVHVTRRRKQAVILGPPKPPRPEIGGQVTLGGKTTTFGPQISGVLPTKHSPPVFGAQPGTYDPGLDAQVQGAQRGLGDLIGDIGKQTQRNQTDYNLAVQQANRTAGNSLHDLLLGAARTGEGLGIAAQRSQQDYGRSLVGLGRNYAQLAAQQADTQRAMGVDEGGAVQQAADKRTRNYLFDRAPIDTAQQRTQSDITRQGSQLRTDTKTQQGRLQTGLATTLGQLGLNLQRSTEDSATQQARAQRETTQFAIDVNKQKAYVAGDQAGHVSKMHVSDSGVQYATIHSVKGKHGPRFVLADGTMVSKRPK